MSMLSNLFDPNNAGQQQQQLAQTTVNTAANQENGQTQATLAQLQKILAGKDPARQVTTPTIGAAYSGFNPGAPTAITQQNPAANVKR